MFGRLRAIGILAGVVALLAWGANALIDRITNSWIEQDAVRRAGLVVSAANASLVRRWSTPDDLRVVLLDISRDEQVLAVAACGPGGAPVAATELFPVALTCDALGAMPSGGDSAAAGDDRIRWLHGVPVSVIAITDGGVIVGRLALVHDMRLGELRHAQVKGVIFGAFALFGIASLVFAFFNRRFLGQSWTREIRLVLGGFSNATQFRAVLADIRTLAARVTAEGEARDDERTWTPARIRTLVHEMLDGARVVILANREPVVHQRDERGATQIMRPASGLVTALVPVIRACNGTWVAHGSGSADRDFVDKHDRLQVPAAEGAYTLRRVWLTSDEERGYYYGFANEGLWPLCHIAHQRPTFRSGDFDQYRAVNRRFVDAVCDEVDGEDPIILVQDYHFALAPALLRERLPAATILAFWHVPWPNAESLGICPWRAELIQGLLGASIVGFHTQQHCNNFIDSVDAFMEARIDRERNAVFRHGHRTLVRPYPISVEWPSQSAEAPAAPTARAQILARYGLRAGALLGVGVDRLDYTKGLEERFQAVERLLDLHPEYRGRFTFVQIAAPSRTEIPAYQDLSASVTRLVERVNGRFGSGDYRPIVFLREHHGRESIVDHFRAADVCYVSSVHDGMNLVAKEFVVSRDDERGVLVLSYFAGASRELTEALIVNPYDTDSAAHAMARALAMPVAEQRERMRAMRTQVRERNVFRWAGRLLSDAARERRRVQLAERLSVVPEVRMSV